MFVHMHDTFMAARSSSTSMVPPPSESKVSKTSRISISWQLDLEKHKFYVNKYPKGHFFSCKRKYQQVFHCIPTCSSVRPCLALRRRWRSSSPIVAEPPYQKVENYFRKRERSCKQEVSHGLVQRIQWNNFSSHRPC
jgi:hypothetical protein